MDSAEKNEPVASGPERQRVEEALRESEEKFRAIADYTAEWENWIGPDGKLLWVSPGVERVTGYSVSEFRTMHTLSMPLSAEEDRETVRAQFQRAMAGTCETDQEFRFVHKDGTTRWGSVSWQPIFARDGTPLGHRSSIRDITRRKRAEEALRESQALTNAIVDSTSDMIWSVDPESFGLLAFNCSLSDYFLQQRGIRIQTGMRPEDLFPAEDFVHTWHGFYQRALSEGTYTVDYLVYAGSNILQLTFNLLKRDGKVFGISVFGKDITERKRVEEVLQGSEARLRAVFENSMVGILLSAPDGRVFAANPAACRLFGRTEEDICRLGRSGLVDRRDSRMNVLVQERAEKGYAVGEMTLVRADGTCFPAQVASVVFETAEGPRTAMVIQDLSERKLTEARITDFARKLLSVREEEKRRFSAVLHHDVGSFTVGVSARLNAVEDDLRAGEKQKALAALRACRRLFTQSVRRLRTLAVELRPPNLDILGLPATLREHFRLMTRETSLKIHFTDATRGAAIPPGTQIVLFRTVQECLNNVVRHAHARQVRVRLAVLRKTLRLSIADDGKGFDPARSAAKPGTHLGLRAIQEMVAALGGNVVVESAARHGATVRVAIPQEGPPP